ncbi:MAG: PAS domain-containing protein [Sedimentisphaerales bacterium]|nr:PAS domain-containing protein [Sedimentisphaerales bacterium]
MPGHEPSIRILCLDDEDNIRNSFVRQFRNVYEVTVASDAEQALACIGQSDPFAVIITDLRMPGMDGLAFLHAARRMTPDSVFIMLTGHAEAQVAVKAVNEGRVFRFLTKPCPVEMMRQTLEEAVVQYRKIEVSSTFTYTARVEDAHIVKVERNQGCLGVTGYAAQEFEKAPSLWKTIIVPEHRERVRREVHKILSGREISPFEFKIRQKNGSLCWVRTTLIGHRDEHDVVRWFDAMVQDITEAKQMEQALQQSEARYQRMVSNVPGLVFQFLLRTDGTMQFLFVGDNCLQLFGLNPDELREDYSLLFERFEAKDRAEILHLMAESAEQLSPWEWWTNGRFNGQPCLIQGKARPERLENGDILWDGLMIDMTEYRRKEEQIHQLARFTDENPNPVLRVDGQGVILYANKASEPLLQLWSRRTGQSLPDKLLSTVAALKSSGTHECLEVQCKDRIFSIVFASIKEADYVNLYARDMTDVKLAHQELIRANDVLREHDRLKSEFVSTVSHELRTPLCIFKNIVSNAMAGVMGKVSHKLYESLRMADKSIDRLSRIISDFLDISKIEAGTLKLHRDELSIQALVNEVVESLDELAAAKGIDIIPHMPRHELTVSADRDRIIQVLTNLIGNAIKFIPVNGTIEVNVVESDQEVEITVKDDGPGLAREEMEKIFDRFVQIHQIAGAGEHGTGLGLAITKELVEMHGGRIWVESAPAQGCRFCFTLPKQEPVGAMSEEAEILSATSSRGFPNGH